MISKEIHHEIMAYEKQNGKKPAMLILVGIELRDKFFSEILQFTMETEGADFKTPGSFMGVPFYFKNVWTYGGSCQWLLVGEQ